MPPVTRLLPVVAAVLVTGCTAMLITGCTAMPVASMSDPTSGPASLTTPRYSGPAVITESALPTDDSTAGDDGTTANPPDAPQPDPVRSSTGAVPAADGLAGCALPFLRVTVRPVAARHGHAGYLLSFTNTGQIACQLTGYPAVTVLSSAGRPVLRASPTPSGYLGGVRGKPVTVLIASGQPASALLEGEQVDPSGARCPARPGLLIVPPGSATPARVPVATAICAGVQIHPVVAGSAR